MESTIVDAIANLGVAGLVVAMLFMYSKYMTKKEADGTKALLDDYRNQLKELTSINRSIENSFRDYLILEGKEQREIIKANTEAIKQILDFFDKQFGEYMQVRIKSQDRLSEKLETFIVKIGDNM